MIPAGFLAPGWKDAPVGDVDGEPCAWPFDPLLVVANGPVPLGQYHCPSCGSMVVAGVPHPDYRVDHSNGSDARFLPGGDEGDCRGLAT